MPTREIVKAQGERLLESNDFYMHLEIITILKSLT